MGFQEERGIIEWKMHFNSEPEDVYEGLATPEGRAEYWAESADENEDIIEFRILGYPPFKGKVLDKIPGVLFKVEYFGTVVTFKLESDGGAGTDMHLIAEGVEESIKSEMTAGWVSVLLAMKAALDFGADLRNHDPNRTWTKGYADN